MRSEAAVRGITVLGKGNALENGTGRKRKHTRGLTTLECEVKKQFYLCQGAEGHRRLCWERPQCEQFKSGSRNTSGCRVVV